jgi:hypothetical protein
MRLSDDAFQKLLTSLVKGVPTPGFPDLTDDVASCVTALLENPDELVITLLSLYVLRTRSVGNKIDPAIDLVENIRARAARGVAMNEGDWLRLTDSLRTVMQADYPTDAATDSQNEDPPGLGRNHPLAGIVGRYKDDPAFDRYLEELEKYRQEVTERDLAELELAETE